MARELHSTNSKSATLRDRLDFLEIDDESRRQLVAFMPIMEEHLDSLFDDFYGHVMSWSVLQDKIGNASNVQRLKDAQKTHWRQLFSGRFDDRYAEQVRRVGLAHLRVGLEPSWYMGGYAYVLARVVTFLSDRYRRRPQKLVTMMHAVTKAIFLDMDMAMTVYHEELQANHKAKLDELATEFEASVKAIADSLSSSATEMEASAESMAATAEQTNQQSAAAASASEQASTNVQTVASAAEELSKSVEEIGGQVQTSTQIATRAVEQAELSNSSIKGLAEAGEQIGEVVKLISDIAEQTNLLALNATIEAARAGDAGKGFAVVAAEVKSLANQTAGATNNIAEQISAMQREISGSVEAIQEVSAIIGQINAVATTVAAAVDEQGAATQEIARNVNEAAIGTREVSANISNLKESVGQTGETSAQVLKAAAELSRQGEMLREKVDTFLGAVRHG